MIKKSIRWLWVLIALWALAPAQPAQAHAVLERSEPSANAALNQAPAEIRLWFTEPLEPTFSSITLRNMTGATLETPTTQVDAADAHQMFMQPGDLPDGLYTVVYSVVSAADGHHTEGSFPFIVGAATGDLPIAPVINETIPVDGAWVRWINFLGLALGVGSLGFLCFVWQPAMTGDWPAVERRMSVILWLGWLLLGLGGLLMLLLQTSIVTNRSLAEALDPALLSDVVRNTRFGILWSARMALWLLMGGMLWLGRENPMLRWVSLLLGAAILLVHSLYSHAAAAQEALPAIASNWVHLAMTALWIGGLVQFFGIINPLRRSVEPAAPVLGRLVVYFSNYARIAVAGLMITGLYALWLHVGTIEGLLTTLYGRALLLKLILILPLLLIAALNLLLTQQRLRKGEAVWVGRLRGLIGAEIVLTLGVLAVVGGMTSINPARGLLAQRTMAEAALAAVPQPNPIDEMQIADELHVHLSISPGWVGENTFMVMLTTVDGEPISDASLIRLRFEHETENLGESELRITEAHSDGMYHVTGANLSAPGEWQIRMTVQRPDQFDAVIDFAPQLELPPPPPPAPVIDVNAPLPYRIPMLLATGLLALVVGGYFVDQQSFRCWQGSGLLAATLVLVGGVFLVSTLL